MRERRAGLTLLLCTILHAFTHAYGAMLVPLYLLIAKDLRLTGVGLAAAIVAVYGLVYSILSYPAGVWADRVNRKNLLGFALLVNAVAILLIGLSRRYELILACAVLGGMAGTIFHPAANALVPAHFPRSPGLAIGLLGVGAGLGFFAGPQYAGWRAQAAGWHAGNIANWQRPCIELGGAGVVAAFIFLLLASEAGPSRAKLRPPLGRLRWQVTLVAAVLGLRDFAGVASLSLVSIYLQKAMGRNAKQAGLIVGTMMLTAVVINPLAVFLSGGRRRLPSLACALVLGGLVVATVPLWPGRYVLVVLCLFQGFQLGSYAMSDAAMLERVDASVRGRVVGLFLTLAGTFAATGPWVMGWWVDQMGPSAARQTSYLAPFGLLAVMMVAAAFSTPLIARLGEPVEHAIDPLSEIVPATIEPAA